MALDRGHRVHRPAANDGVALYRGFTDRWFGAVVVVQQQAVVPVWWWGAAAVLDVHACCRGRVPTAFPVLKTGSFFSTSMIEPPADIDVLAHFIPANIFSALASNQVPAIVLFSLGVGLALSTIPQRKKLLDQLDLCAAALIRISSLVTRLAPLGIFAIAASTVGTVSLSEISRLQVYLVAYTAGAVFLAFVVLPLLVTTLTSISYREVLHVVQEPMLTAFATGKLMITLPMLIDNTEQLLRKHSIGNRDESTPPVSAIYAIAYAFPHVGKLLSMLFIPFAAWFLGTPLLANAYPGLLANGLFAYFGGPIVAIPYLLDRMHLPHDMFQLFLVSGVYGERLGDALGAMHLCGLTMIAVFALKRNLQFRPLRLMKYALTVSIGGLVMLTTVRGTVHRFVTVAEERRDIVDRIQLLNRPVESVVLSESAPNPDPLNPQETLGQRVQRRGILRVGYNDDKRPFAFLNSSGKLVGYDINMAHELARDLGVTLEFVHFERSTLIDQLNADHFDVVMSGLVATLPRAQAMQHTSRYRNLHLALVTADYRVKEFRTMKSIAAQPNLKIGLVELSRGFVDRVHAKIPNATFVKFENNRDFFTAEPGEIDAMLMSLESGSAFTLVYPEYDVVVPAGLNVQLPLFYAVGKGDMELRDLLEHWTLLRQLDGTSDEFYDHWILGKTLHQHEPRWSVIRNVLHWVD